MQRQRQQQRENYPAAREAYDDLDAADALELQGKAPDPARAARPPRAPAREALKRARRRE